MSQPQPIRVANYPFPALLYLEWGLLAVVLVSQLLPNPFRDTGPLLRLGAFLSTTGLGLMGLRLPQGSLRTRLAYTALQMGLLLLVSWWGGLRGLRLFPLLSVVLIIRHCLMFRLPGRVITSALLYGLFLGLLLTRLARLGELGRPIVRGAGRLVISSFAFNVTLLLLLVILFLLLLMSALLNERRSRNELMQAHRQLQQYALQVETLAATQERNRIAREIHDSLGHSLTALNLQLEGALKLWSSQPERAQGFLQQAKTLGSTALQDVRRSVAAMRSDPIQPQKLPDALLALAQEFERMTGLQPICDIQLAELLPADLALALYRITQEALTNICKHAEATQVQIALRETDGKVVLTIQDNGRGFAPTQTTTGFGLQGMRERAAALGGTLTWESSAGQGCRVIGRFPSRATIR
ncbi:MAG: sensor histidine kinase [Elainella sp.]